MDSLPVDRLRRSLPASIRSTIADLPECLIRLTLLGIDKENENTRTSIPVPLCVHSTTLRSGARSILAVQFDATANPSFYENSRPLDAEEAVLLSACSSLIAVVDKQRGKLWNVLHFSVMFLISDRLATASKRLSCYHILPEPAHELLARAGFTFLLRLDDMIDRNAIVDFLSLRMPVEPGTRSTMCGLGTCHPTLERPSARSGRAHRWQARLLSILSWIEKRSPIAVQAAHI
jgi:hypothetical protein